MRSLALALAALLTAPTTTSAQEVDPYLGVPVGGGPVDVGPTPAGLEATDARSCGRCHARHYRQWRRSAHRSAFTNALFQAEFNPRRRPFCARCHAPRPDERAGVDCAVCHVRDGFVLNPTVTGRAPHASRATPEVAGSLACARCHEFEFERQPGDLLQRTITEWTTSARRDTSCQGCHVPARGQGHAHDLPGGLDRRLLRDAIEVSASARRGEEATTLTLSLSAGSAGHAVPTGDIFRRIVVRAWPAGRPADAETAILRRRFRIDRAGWHELDDRRVPASGAREVVLTLPAGARSVAYVVDLWRTPPARARREGWPARRVRRRLRSGVVRARR